MATTKTTTFALVLGELAESFQHYYQGGCPLDSEDGAIDLRHDCPDWIVRSNIMRKIHRDIDDRPIDDWVYSTASSVASWLRGRDVDVVRDDISYGDAMEGFEALVDSCPQRLTKWLASHIENARLCDEEEKEHEGYYLDDLRRGAPVGILKRIANGQKLAIARIGYAILGLVSDEAWSRDSGNYLRRERPLS